MNRSHSRAEASVPERPITFRAAEDLGAFELAQLWADCTAWNLNERTAYDELAELACMSALAEWLTRWQPIAIHSAVLAGARMEAIAGALGSSLQEAFDRWHDWALASMSSSSTASRALRIASTRRWHVGSPPSESNYQRAKAPVTLGVSLANPYRAATSRRPRLRCPS